VALAHALEARGHEVVVGTPVNLVGFVDRCGLRSSPLAINSQEFLESPEGRKWLASGNVREFTDRVMAVNHQHANELDRDVLKACEGADAIVSGFLTEDRAACVAEARNLRLALLHMVPLRPTGGVAHSVVTARALPFEFLNRATYTLFDKLWWGGCRDDIDHFRKKLGLPKASMSTLARTVASRTLVINAYSRHLVPPMQDWPDEQMISGAFSLPSAMRARLGESVHPEGLAGWLSAGEKPVFLGFGSMPVTDPEAMMAIVLRVTEKLGVRAVVGAGWTNLDAVKQGLPDRVRIVDAVDHDWLLPRCSAAVHHGGSGTTVAALRAGLPSLVCSVFADQPFWGARVERLGAGVHLPFARFGEASLEAGLRKILTPEPRDRAVALGQAIADEGDGIPVAVRALERRFGIQRHAEAYTAPSAA
jgi:sterol 3beta-glucosyltransferase